MKNITITDDDETTLLQMQVPDFDVLTGVPAILSAIASAAKPGTRTRKKRSALAPKAPAAPKPAATLQPA